MSTKAESKRYKVSVNDDRSLAVKVIEAQSHIMKDGVTDLLSENAISWA